MEHLGKRREKTLRPIPPEQRDWVAAIVAEQRDLMGDVGRDIVIVALAHPMPSGSLVLGLHVID